MNYKQWDIVLIKFPFTNLTNYKVRPALVISNPDFNKFDNLMLIWIYWNKWNTSYSLPIKQNDLNSWKFKKQSYFRFQNIFSLEKKLIERKVANIKTESLEIINQRISNYLKIN